MISDRHYGPVAQKALPAAGPPYIALDVYLPGGTDLPKQFHCLVEPRAEQMRNLFHVEPSRTLLKLAEESSTGCSADILYRRHRPFAPLVVFR